MQCALDGRGQQLGQGALHRGRGADRLRPGHCAEGGRVLRLLARSAPALPASAANTEIVRRAQDRDRVSLAACMQDSRCATPWAAAPALAWAHCSSARSGRSTPTAMMLVRALSIISPRLHDCDSLHNQSTRLLMLTKARVWRAQTFSVVPSPKVRALGYRKNRHLHILLPHHSGHKRLKRSC